jgi:uncharacterized protein (TIGR00730 family)
MSKKEIYLDQQKTLEKMHEELENGFKVIEKNNKTVTIFGSARLKPDSPYYILAKELAGRISRELKYNIVTGGGPGIMEAASIGGKSNGDSSTKVIGFTIRLPHEQQTNPGVDIEVPFSHFSTRKTAMTFAAEAFIFFPGGFGTLDELFSIVTMIQTGKIPRIPVILFGKDFWKKLEDMIEEDMVKKYNTVSVDETKIYKVTDDEDEVIDIIKNAPVSDWWSEK